MLLTYITSVPHVSCDAYATAGLVPPQHSSGEDAEAGAPEADPQQPHHGLAETQLPLQTPGLLQRERSAAQLRCEAIRALGLSVL